MKAFAGKALVLFAIVFVLMIGLFQVDDLVNERLRYREQAMAEVSQGLSGPQLLAGPLLRLPYVEKWKEDRLNDKGKVIGTDDKSAQEQLWLLPENLEIVGLIEPDFRKRGLFRVAGYQSKIRIKGHFLLPAAPPAAAHPKGQVSLEEGAEAVLGLHDPRGIRSLSMNLAGKPLNFEPGTGINGLNGAHAVFGKASADGSRIDFDLVMELTGAEQLHILPLGKSTTAALSSPWPHPSFFGNFLPVESKVSAAGFTARWQVSNLANAHREDWLEALSKHEIKASGLGERDKGFGVRILEPVNTYSLTDRAIKYGLLFVLSTLGVFSLFELLKQLQVHPLQYLMIGAALLLFFVLLLSLSERFGFAAAYGGAALACVALIGYYSRFVLGGWRPASLITGQLALTFGSLYALLQSEENALLIGSLMMFAVLAAVMIGTRKVNWFEKFSGISMPRGGARAAQASAAQAGAPAAVQTAP